MDKLLEMAFTQKTAPNWKSNISLVLGECIYSYHQTSNQLNYKKYKSFKEWIGKHIPALCQYNCINWGPPKTRQSDNVFPTLITLRHLHFSFQGGPFLWILLMNWSLMACWSTLPWNWLKIFTRSVWPPFWNAGCKVKGQKLFSCFTFFLICFF